MIQFFKALFGLSLVFLICAIVAYIYTVSRAKPLDGSARQKALGQFLETSQGTLHYRWHGTEGDPIIVMVHGFSTPNFIFEQNAQALVTAGFRVLTFDHFGRGWSDRPRTKYTPNFYDRELTDLVNGLGITQPFGLVGLSMGGPITVEFAARHPARVSKLFLFVPAGLTLGAQNGSFNDRLLRSPLIGDIIWRLLGKNIILGDPQYDETNVPAENRLHGDVSIQMEYAGYFEALLSSYRHLPMQDQDGVYRRLRDAGIPVLAVFGEKDTTVLIDSAKRLEAALPKADIKILREGEHGLNYQMQETTGPMLTNFFSAN